MNREVPLNHKHSPAILTPISAGAFIIYKLTSYAQQTNHGRQLATIENTAKGSMTPIRTQAIYQWHCFLFYLRLTIFTQNNPGIMTAREVPLTAPTTLNTAQIESTLTATPIIIKQRRRVNSKNCLESLFLRFLCSSLSAYQLSSWEESQEGGRQPDYWLEIWLRAGLLALSVQTWIIAMKVFLQPKNIRGQVAKLLMRNPPLISMNTTWFVFWSSIDSKKLPSTSSPARIYPRIPKRAQATALITIPRQLATSMLLSVTLLIPLKMGKKFCWKVRERNMVGMAASALSQSVGKACMCLVYS